MYTPESPYYEHDCFQSFPFAAEESCLLKKVSDQKYFSEAQGFYIVFTCIYNVYLLQNAVTFTTTKKNVKKTLESKNTLCGLKVITANDLTELFDSQKAKDILFPENRIVVNSIPYKLVKTNIAHILNSERVMYASVEELHYKHFPYVLSVVNQIKCDSGTRINFDFFGEKNDKQEVSEHFNAHVRRCLSTCDESLSIYLTYSKHVDFGTFATVFPWESIDTDIQYGIEELI